MSWTRVRAVVISIALCSVASTIARAESADLKPTIEARYADLKEAMAARDGTALGAILAPDFVSVEVTGESQTAAEMIDSLAELKPDPKKISTTSVLSVSETADGVVAEQRYDMKTEKTGPDGAPYQFEMIALSTDLWVKPGDQWLLQKTVTNDITVLKDGQVAVHKTRP